MRECIAADQLMGAASATATACRGLAQQSTHQHPLPTARVGDRSSARSWLGDGQRILRRFEQPAAAFADVVGIFLIATVAKRAVQLARHDVGEADHRIEGRASSWLICAISSPRPSPGASPGGHGARLVAAAARSAGKGCEAMTLPIPSSKSRCSAPMEDVTSVKPAAGAARPSARPCQPAR